MLSVIDERGCVIDGQPVRENVNALTDEQRRLVRDNIGLVAVHLRRFGNRPKYPRRDREREDLFQEGCLGLIQAAVTYRISSGLPFAAYALPRIHHAVSKAIHQRFSLIRVPVFRRRTVAPLSDKGATTFRSRSFDEVDRHPAANDERRDPRWCDNETIGDRLRGKYERALDEAGRRLTESAGRRGDRDHLVRVLREERFLIPQEEYRTALRQIARVTRSSYARVAQCDKQLGACVQEILTSDPEFAALQSHARQRPLGTSEAIDVQLERELAGEGAAVLAERFCTADRAGRAEIIAMLLDCCPVDPLSILRRRVRRLDANARERLLRMSQCVTRGRADKSGPVRPKL